MMSFGMKKLNKLRDVRKPKAIEKKGKENDIKLPKDRTSLMAICARKQPQTNDDYCSSRET